ncbi:hypothetical protein MHU86_25360 [Fragilaria crotonensis]|nr:hypothetical protein MHU86_25360 [Fragilaria crotonensis]
MVPGAREQGGGHFIARLRARRRRGHLAHQETWLTLCPTELQDHPLAASPHFADWRLAASAKTQLLPTQPAPSAAAAGTATHDSSSESESTSTLSPPVRTKRKDGNLRVFRCRPSGRTASLRQPATDGNGAMSGTIRATLDGVAQTFRLNKLESPIHDSAGRLDPFWLYN